MLAGPGRWCDSKTCLHARAERDTCMQVSRRGWPFLRPSRTRSSWTSPRVRIVVGRREGLWGPTSPGAQRQSTGLVVSLTDGDTITVLDDRLQQHKIRLARIDAPEKRQDFGQRAKQTLAAMTFASRVTVEAG